MEKRQENVQKVGKKLGNKGFSLVELIVVIAIMAILTVVIAPQFMRYIEKSRESVDAQTIDSIQSAIQATLADEAAWDAITGDVTITYLNDGKVPTIAGAGAAFSTEFNLNITKIVKFKSKECKGGAVFTIKGDTKDVTVVKVK